MTEVNRFREVRKGERRDVLAFAGLCGLSTDGLILCHHMSLVLLDEEGERLAAALCFEDKQGRHQVKIVTLGDSVDQSLVNELTDRGLRKVQSEAIGTARLCSPNLTPAETVLSDANWLDTVQETVPPELQAPVDGEDKQPEPSEAA